MKLQTIENALKHYMLSADCSKEEREDVDSALRTCHAVAERYDDRERWQDSVQMIPTSVLVDFLNTTTYDVYGKLAKIHNGKVPFSYYKDAVRKETMLSQLTDGQLECGYELINDLWQDNNSSGENNIDGTFPNSKLDRIMYYLDAYCVTNDDVLDDGTKRELVTLLGAINALR